MDKPVHSLSKLECYTLYVIGLAGIAWLLWVLVGCAGPGIMNDDGTITTPHNIPGTEVPLWHTTYDPLTGENHDGGFDWLELAKWGAGIIVGGPAATLAMGLLGSPRVRKTIARGKVTQALGWKHSTPQPIPDKET